MNGRQRFELYIGLHQLNVGCHKEVAGNYLQMQRFCFVHPQLLQERCQIVH